MKCDEQKPACHRCTSTGRSCDWFNEKTATTTTTVSEPSSRNALVLRHPPSEFTELKSLELRGFEFFCNKTARELPGFFNSRFWESLVLQLSHSETAVLHAAIALGSLHESEEKNGMLVSRERLIDPRHSVALRQYNVAIAGLRNRMATSEREQKVIALAACLLFIHIELLRGRYDPAIAHLQSGLKILREMNTRSANADIGQDEDDKSIDSMMATAFARLDLQTAHFGLSTPAMPYAINNAECGVQQLSRNGFENLVHAKARCDTLMGSTFHFLAKYRPPSSPQALETQDAAIEQKRLLTLHLGYMDALDRFLDQPDKIPSKKNCQGVILLRMHLLTTYTLVSVCLAENEEEAFDQYLAEFKKITSLAKEFLSSFSGANLQGPRLPSLSTDWGIIPPLAVTVMKCRDPNTRRNALSILASWPHREGFWDASLVIKLGQQIIDIEESTPPQGGFDQSSHVARMANVFLEVAEDQDHGILTWQRLEPGSAEGRINESYLMHL